MVKLYPHRDPELADAHRQYREAWITKHDVKALLSHHPPRKRVSPVR